jgi:exportin-2 (importin alpha re-exporter)
MLSMPIEIQKQLGAALEVISQSDFPTKWQELLPTLVGKFSTGDFNVIVGVLQTINAILKRYRKRGTREQRIV